MANLTYIEKTHLEKMFGMAGGYVLNFSDRTFREFVAESTGVDIYNSKYNYASGSKANRLRAFWKIESDFIVARLLEDLLKYGRECGGVYSGTGINEICDGIVSKLKQSSVVDNVESIVATTDEKSFELLARSVRDSIERNEPESGLDRLHTFVVKFLRVLCKKHGIEIDKNKPAHSLMGEYIKHLRINSMIESEMTERILKSSISILESFNDVRNNKSYAHDNAVLNYNESTLIFNNISSAIKFINQVEMQAEAKNLEKEISANPEDELPF